MTSSFINKSLLYLILINSPSKAFVLGELKEAKRTITLQDEAIRRLEEKLQRVDMKQPRSSYSIHGERHYHRPSSRGSSNDHGREEEHRRRRPHPTFMDIDLMLMEIDVKMDITKTPRLSFLWSKFLVLMGIVILMCT